MKVTVDVDCTPEEARRFMGLPDLSGVHEAYLEKMRKTIMEGATPEHFSELLKAWGPASEGAINVWKTMFEQMAGPKK